jgi:hypothetical protein
MLSQLGHGQRQGPVKLLRYQSVRNGPGDKVESSSPWRVRRLSASESLGSHSEQVPYSLSPSVAEGDAKVLLKNRPEISSVSTISVADFSCGHNEREATNTPPGTSQLVLNCGGPNDGQEICGLRITQSMFDEEYRAFASIAELSEAILQPSLIIQDQIVFSHRRAIRSHIDV